MGGFHYPILADRFFGSSQNVHFTPMIRVIVQDASTVFVNPALGPVTLTGPLDCTFDVPVGTTLGTPRIFTDGVVVVKANKGTIVSSIDPLHSAALPYSVAFFFILGVAAAACRRLVLVLCFLLAFSSPVLADYTVHTVTKTLVNETEELQRKRISMWETTTGEATSGFRVPAGTASWTENSATKVETRLAIYNQSDFSLVTITVAAAQTITPGPVTISWPEYTGPVDHLWFVEYRLWFGFWTGWGSTESYTGPGTGGLVMEAYSLPGGTARGTLIRQWEIEVGPHTSTTLQLQHPTAFEVEVANYEAVQTPDGGGAIAWVPESAEGVPIVDSSEPETVVSEETTPEVVNEAATGPIEYSSGSPVPPAVRPADVSTNAGMNDAAEARHTEGQGILSQIKAASDAGVRQTASGQAQATADSKALKASVDALAQGDSAGLGAGIDGQMAEADGRFDGTDTVGMSAALGELAGNLASLGDSFQVAVTGAALPELGIQLPAALGGEFVSYDLEEYAWVWSILRAALLLTITYFFVLNLMATARSAFA